jgi:hypothetical protein
MNYLLSLIKPFVASLQEYLTVTNKDHFNLNEKKSLLQMLKPSLKEATARTIMKFKLHNLMSFLGTISVFNSNFFARTYKSLEK